jgi:ribonucleoside-diphosphate reductase alpha chain
MPSPSPSSNRRAWCRATTAIKNATSILDYIFRELAVSYLDRTDLAHVKPEGASFDDLGRGEEEGVSNITEGQRKRGGKPVARGAQADQLHRLPAQALPQELVVLHGAARWGPRRGARIRWRAADAGARKGGGRRATGEQHDSVTTGAVSTDGRRTKAKMQGYEGEACGECGNYTLVRNGTCMKCNTCGATSGCS